MNKVNDYLSTIKGGIAAGVCISIGCTAYLATDNKIVGAFLFTVGLFIICLFGLDLYTGKIGYALKGGGFVRPILALIGNFVGVCVSIIIIYGALPDIIIQCNEVATMKLSQSAMSAASRAICCGTLMFVAVDNFKRQTDGILKSIGIVLCVPTFILCGFEHSIADMFYLLMASLATLQKEMFITTLIYLLIIIVYNGIGAMVMCWLISKSNKE